MKIVCSWCSGPIPQDKTSEGEGVSHGICESCRDYFFSPNGPPSFVGFLDMFSIPVLVVDEELKVVAVNEKARKITGKSSEELQDASFGEAVECPYARLPEGCGRSVHCKSCTVRLMVLDTFMTGNSHFDVPAYHDQCFYKRERSVCYLISTVKSGNLVYLKIRFNKSKECEQMKAA